MDYPPLSTNHNKIYAKGQQLRLPQAVLIPKAHKRKVSEKKLLSHRNKRIAMK